MAGSFARVTPPHSRHHDENTRDWSSPASTSSSKSEVGGGGVRTYGKETNSALEAMSGATKILKARVATTLGATKPVAVTPPCSPPKPSSPSPSYDASPLAASTTMTINLEEKLAKMAEDQAKMKSEIDRLQMEVHRLKSRDGTAPTGVEVDSMDVPFIEDGAAPTGGHPVNQGVDNNPSGNSTEMIFAELTEEEEEDNEDEDKEEDENKEEEEHGLDSTTTSSPVLKSGSSMDVEEVDSEIDSEQVSPNIKTAKPLESAPREKRDTTVFDVAHALKPFRNIECTADSNELNRETTSAKAGNDNVDEVTGEESDESFTRSSDNLKCKDKQSQFTK